ncbi:T-cell immunomodulatory protein-like [Panonychus citri]|uniref:T-cell immunomodulatory protein-like n=1 Tax=Panonychus citri TaxID=50023 RepID=UPI0023079164|nr:T-cell immunomodulatory protein-like [Panonychus citri]
MNYLWKIFLPILYCYYLFSTACLSQSLLDQGGLLTAFGDLNNDKLTDIFVITDDGKSFGVLLAQDKNVFTEIERKCTIPEDELIVGLIPSDFTGNAMMDILVVSGSPKSTSDLIDSFNLRLLRPNGSSIDCTPLHEPPFATVGSHPALLDYNGDMISDFLAQSDKSQDLAYFVWIGTENGLPEKIPFPPSREGYHPFAPTPMQSPHSNAFIDLNKDGVADIFITTTKDLQYWFADKNGYPGPTYTFNYPVSSIGELKIGQSIFADINADGQIDHLLPVCNHYFCSIYALSWDTSGSHEWIVLLENIKIDGNPYQFVEIDHINFKIPISVRAGDITMDGYPDLIAIMRFGNHLNEVVIFQNEASSNNTFGRHFSPTVVPPRKSLSNAGDPELATFFDIGENGKLDILINTGPLYNHTRPPSTPLQTSKMKIFGEVDETGMDSNFLKVLVTSGLCTDRNCYGKDYYVIDKYRVPYGTNRPGPTVCTSFLDPKGEPMESCAGQLSQSAHFTLQMPYCFFGLGPYANYIERLTATVPAGNTSIILKHVEEDFVPDSQIVIITNPLYEPKRWKVQFWLTPSEFINKTLYTFCAICLILIILIAILHRREVLEDAYEKQLFKGFWVDS